MFAILLLVWRCHTKPIINTKQRLQYNLSLLIMMDIHNFKSDRNYNNSMGRTDGLCFQDSRRLNNISVKSQLEPFKIIVVRP